MQELISPYLDAELGLTQSLEVERHLADCPICSQDYENQQTLRAALRSEVLYFKPSARFAAQLQTAVRREHTNQSRSPGFSWRFSRRWLTLAAATAVLLLVGTLSIRLLSTPSANERLTDEVIASHIRSLMASHLTDVPSTDQHTVKPWFNGKLDFSPPVKDLAGEGFPLIGGRLDYLNNQPVAALVYQRRQHVINLFVWPSTRQPDEVAGAAQRQGFNLLQWSHAGMRHYAVSDLNRSELEQFVTLLQEN